MDSYKEIGSSAAQNAVDHANEAADKGSAMMDKVSDAVKSVGNTVRPAWEKVEPNLPNLSKVYMEPLLPTPSRSLAERYHLITSSARPWRQFFDISQYNLPPFDQMKSRFEHNMETYFYNYFILTVLHIAIFALFHLLPVASLAALAAAAYLLFVRYPADIDVAGMFVLDDTRKKILCGFLAIAVLFFGGVSTLLFSVVIFYVIIVLVHGLLRDDDDYVVIESADV